jgi:hypothetical protein
LLSGSCTLPVASLYSPTLLWRFSLLCLPGIHLYYFPRAM